MQFITTAQFDTQAIIRQDDRAVDFCHDTAFDGDTM